MMKDWHEGIEPYRLTDTVSWYRGLGDKQTKSTGKWRFPTYIFFDSWLEPNNPEMESNYDKGQVGNSGLYFPCVSHEIEGGTNFLLGLDLQVRMRIRFCPVAYCVQAYHPHMKVWIELHGIFVRP